MSAPPVEPGAGAAVVAPPSGGTGGRRPADPGHPAGADAFVGSVQDDGGSLTIMLRGRFDAATVACVAEHIDIALGRGVRFLVVEVVGPLTAGHELGELLGRTQSRLADRRGLLVVRGLGPHTLA